MSKYEEMSKYEISIHVPRVGDDVFRVGEKWDIDISIHVPRVGDDVWLEE